MTSGIESAVMKGRARCACGDATPGSSASTWFSGGSPYASPQDIGPAARRHPEVNLVVYHSGFEAGGTEGPYTAATANVGVNRLITSMKRAGVGPNENVYAELGSTWWYVMRYPVERCEFSRRELEQLRRQLPGRNRTLGPSMAAEARVFRELDHAAIVQNLG